MVRCMPAPDPNNLQFQCCFCGSGITKGSQGGEPLDPCAVVLIARWERPEREQGTQQFFCHLACFQRVCQHAPVYREVLEEGTG
jgi:hypothetical protein